MNDLVFGKGKNTDIKGILTGQFGDHGLMPSKASWMLQAALHVHFARDGGWYPKGGSEILAKRMVECIYANGGKVLVNCNVNKILVEGTGSDEHIEGVECMAEGKTYRIMAREVISSLGIINTYDILGEKYKDARYKEINEKIDYGVFCAYMFIGLKGTAKENKIDSYTHWVHPDYDHDKTYNELTDNPFDEQNKKNMFFVTSNSAKDSTYDERFPGGSTISVICMAKRSWFENCKRDEDYRAIKKHMEEVFLEYGVYKVYPHLREVEFDYTNFATALTNKKYLKTTHGSIYGISPNVFRYTDEGWNLTDIVGPVAGLTFTGQDMLSVGIASSISAGMVTAMRMMGYLRITDML